MALWKIEYWSNDITGNSPIQKWLDKLTEEQGRAVSKQLFYLKEYGNELELPHSKALGKGLFELRDKEYGYRVYYAFHGKYIIILLAAGDKNSQDRDIKTARDRLVKIKKG